MTDVEVVQLLSRLRDEKRLRSWVVSCDDAIDSWHEFGYRKMSVQEWLGWTRAQYEEWVMHGYGPPIKPDAPCMTRAHNYR